MRYHNQSLDIAYRGFFLILGLHFTERKRQTFALLFPYRYSYI